MSTLEQWLTAAKAELGIDLDVDVDELLDMTKVVAHEVARPAAPPDGVSGWLRRRTGRRRADGGRRGQPQGGRVGRTPGGTRTRRDRMTPSVRLRCATPHLLSLGGANLFTHQRFPNFAGGVTSMGGERSRPRLTGVGGGAGGARFARQLRPDGWPAADYDQSAPSIPPTPQPLTDDYVPIH